MKKAVSLFSILVQIGIVSAQQKNIFLQKKIDSLLEIDQLVQQNIIKASQQNVAKAVSDSLEQAKMDVFNRHIPILKNIISRYGLPTYSNVGQKSADNFLIMVNHSFTDIKFQQEVINLAEKELGQKNISGNQVAMLTDKMLIKSGKQQLYGTQCDYDQEGNAIAKNLADPATVNERRKKAGLNPLREYLDFMTELHREMSKKQ